MLFTSVTPHLGHVAVDKEDGGVRFRGEQLAVELVDQSTSAFELTWGGNDGQLWEGRGYGVKRGVVGMEGVEPLGFVGVNVGKAAAPLKFAPLDQADRNRSSLV